MDRTPHINWPVPESFPALASTDVHVWCVWLDDPQAAAGAATLCAAERAKAAAFHFETDRRRYVSAHGFVRGLLARYLGLEPAALEFVTGGSGKPALAGDRGLQFNLSHSGPLGLLALSRSQQVGVDVEQRWEMPDLTRLEERMFTPAARHRQQHLAPELRLRGFYRRWTQLEAIGKCRGTGLELENLVPGSEHLAPADPAPGFTGCVACECPPTRVDFFQFTPGVLSAPCGPTASSHPILPGLPHRQAAPAGLSSA